ncbi:hypothetical protein LTR95_000054 [Oleoguttula sp. CCFEE 5521]
MAGPTFKQSLKQVAQTNPTQIGDPVSLKAETANSKPTPDDTGAKKSDDDKSLKEIAEEKLERGNPTMLGDPVSLKAETANSEPTPDDRGASGGKSKL